MPPPQPSYDATAKTFHWLVAGLLVVQFPLGWLMPGIRRGMLPGAAMSLHISIGMLVLLLIVLRFLWRLAYPVMPEPGLPDWQRVGAELVHLLLYAAVLLTTGSGWLLASARGWTVYLFGLVALPRLVTEASPLGRGVGGWHQTLGWVLVMLIGLHVAAALAHLAVFKDRVMARMLPGPLQ
jgi:cytochrome b561